MNFWQKIKPEWTLRLGLGLMYLYSGSDLFYHPEYWYGFAPQWFVNLISSFVSMDIYLRVQGVGEFVIGLLLLAWFSGKRGVRIASVLGTLELGMILLLAGVDPITFRDIGLFGAALALTLLVFKKDEESPLIKAEESKDNLVANP